ncbi:hypothetical protein B0H19DRAFT_1170092 [Mycena capillaripes]|nr:hypothetical protein B0H19DRAFT_1170092 [Mycena capillaripes]
MTVLRALLLLCALPRLAISAPIEVPTKKLLVQFPAYAPAEAYIQTGLQTGGHGRYLSSGFRAHPVSAANPRSIVLESVAENAKDSPMACSNVALVVVLFVSVALNLGLIFAIPVFLKRQQRELVDIQLREVRLQHASLQREAQLLSSPLQLPPTGGPTPVQMFSTDSSATLVPYNPSRRF